MKSIIIFLILGFACSGFACGQDNDVLKYSGETFLIPVFPLEDYSPKFHLQIEPYVNTTGNYRGYVATWEVSGDKLYLVDIRGWLRDSLRPQRKATLELLFPSKVKAGRVFAEWFSGKIFSPGYRWGATYKKDLQERHEAEASLIITVENGNVTEIKDKRVFGKPLAPD